MKELNSTITDSKLQIQEKIEQTKDTSHVPKISCLCTNRDGLKIQIITNVYYTSKTLSLFE